MRPVLGRMGKTSDNWGVIIFRKSKCFRYPCTVFYRIMLVNYPIISMLVVLEMSECSRYPCIAFRDAWVVI